MKKETDTRCARCHKGATWVLVISRLEEGMGHRVYQCDNPDCRQKFKFIPGRPKPILFTRKAVARG